MSFAKKFKLGLLAVLAAAFSSMAAAPSYKNDVYPFTFGSMDTTEQLKLWNRLMKYKIFATGLDKALNQCGPSGTVTDCGTGVTAEERVHITDEVGYVGSAKGDFKMKNDTHEFGGPILFGGSFIAGTGGDIFINGPTRFKHAFNAGNNTNRFSGKYCFDGGYNQNAKNGVDNGGGKILESSQCSNADSVYNVDSDLDVPELQSAFSSKFPSGKALSANTNNRQMFIHVPPYTETDSSAYMAFIDSIVFAGDAPSTLHVVMPPNGRLTKIFVNKGIKFSTTHYEISVVYSDGDWDNKNEVWTNFTDKPLANSEYAGNLLFYTPNDLIIETVEKVLQGTYISGSNIYFGHNTNFAGQILAKHIYIGANFAAEDFRYVPFNPPVLDPTAFASGRFIESNRDTILPIKLDKATETGVSFKYCFDIADSSVHKGDTASIQDFNVTTLAKVPVCSKKEYVVVTIPKDSTAPENGHEVYLNVVKENPNLEEGTEVLPFKVFDMSGAVMPGNKREGYFYIKIDDFLDYPKFEKTKLDTVPENARDSTVIDTLFGHYSSTDARCVGCTFKLIDSSDYVIVMTDGRVLVKNSTKLDFEAPLDSFTFRVRVTGPDKMYSDTTITVYVKDINEKPVLADTSFTVPENNKVGDTVATLVAKDPDVRNIDFSTLTYQAIGGDTAVFKVLPDGVITIKKSIDYENDDTLYTLKVRVVDKYGLADTATVKIHIKDVLENSKVKIVTIDDGKKVWENPDTVYTNNPGRSYCWTQDDKKMCADTTFTEGKNIIKRCYQDSTRNKGAYCDSAIVMFSSAAPIVTISANAGKSGKASIYTIVEHPDKDDPNIYVNKDTNDIMVTVKDPVTGVSENFTVKLDLATRMSVPSSAYNSLSSVAAQSIALNENPSGAVTRTPVNGTEIKVSYKEKVAGIEVTVSYLTDNDGEILKRAVVNDKGKIDSIEVITVSYEVTVGGKTVVVSYLANAVTGSRLVTDASGNLMAESSAAGKSGIGIYNVTYDYVDKDSNWVEVAYRVDEKGNLVKDSEGNLGFEVSYTYVNKYGNAATQSVYIVLDKIGPEVKIVYPDKGQVIRSNYTKVTWLVDGEEQDSLLLQGLDRGQNRIIRVYRDKAGNEASDTVIVIMKDGKDVDISVVKPVTIVPKDEVLEYYKDNPLKKGEKYAVSIKIPSTCNSEGKCSERETLVGGSFGTEKGEIAEVKHFGPTLELDIKLPTVSGVGGLATLDDLVGSDGLVAIDGVDAAESRKMTVEEYVGKYCKDVKAENLSRVNLYKSELNAKIWVYSTLGNFVNSYSFTQEMNDPDYANEVGMLQMFFEMKPDEDGYVRAKNKKLLATGAYVYKVEAKIVSELRCTLPNVDDANGKKVTQKIRTGEDMLKPFGYKRPKD